MTSIKAADPFISIAIPRSLSAAALEEPGEGDLYSIGTIARIIEQIPLGNGVVKAVVSGTRRARLLSLAVTESFMEGTVEILENEFRDPHDLSAAIEGLTERLSAPELALHVRKLQELLEADLH